ncbi:MAG: type II secretion system F family protein [Candidatus Synoicihabitans palmerolidicus]|nr:type II secretion system F family protein [Candidatus Synoicihabitans palmerolidicus]
MMKHMVKAGESTGNVDGMMNKVADFYDTEILSRKRQWRP